MNEATADIIDLLNRYELDFGADPVDAEFLGDTKALRDRVVRLLVQPPIWISAEYADRLRADIAAADWTLVADEQRRRIAAADTLQAGSRNPGRSSTPAAAQP